MKVMKYVGLSVLTLILLFGFIFTLSIVLNKNDKLKYEDMDAVDKKMFEQLSSLFADDMELSSKLIVARSNGFVFRGGTYCFNIDFYKKNFLFGWTQAIFATEILLPDELNLPSVYRISAFTPGTFEIFFNSRGTMKLGEDEVSFFDYNDNGINGGSFLNEIKPFFNKTI
ncbi:MAG: hypothetical protein RRY79_01440 [Clostridia bacterium]